MTGGYYGSGYETTIFEYDCDHVVGLEEEKVPLRFLEHMRLPKGTIMFYRASKRNHSQEHPEKFSISVNLLVVNAKESLRTQYQFDLDQGQVKGPIQNTAAAQQIVCCAAAFLGGDRTASRLDDLSSMHPNARFRRNCIESLAHLDKSRLGELRTRAENDQHPFVRKAVVA